MLIEFKGEINLKNPWNFIKKANKFFNLYLENFDKNQKFIEDFYKYQEAINQLIADNNQQNKEEKLSNSLKEKLLLEFKENERKFRENTVNQMPNILLEQKHVNNAKILLNREELLKNFPKNSICAEIGVAKGDFSQLILQINKPKKLHLVDAWHSKRYDSSLENLIKQKFAPGIESNQIVLNKGLSTDILPEFEDHYFDWVYIDTAHDYNITAQELSICSKKVKKGGIIAGHDFSMGNWIEGVIYGVINAVYEFCKKNDWEILYITAELVEKSFAIRKIN